MNLFKWIFLAAVGVGVSLLPIPEGLKKETMIVLAIYVTAILGLIIRPAGESVILIVAAGLGSLFTQPTNVLNGFSSTTVWLVFIAFLISMAFTKTGIGARVAYHLIGLFGKTTLRLGYIMAVVDLFISPVTPSNTARSGGIVYPIFRSIAMTLGSTPGPTGKKVGSYFTLLQALVSYTTAAMFITACAPNSVTVEFAKKILSTEISWSAWAGAMVAPGIILLLIVPFLLYKIYPPEIKEITNAKAIAEEGLSQLGPMKQSEKIVIGLFLFAIIGWAFGDVLKLDAASVALGFLALSLLSKVFTIEDILENKSAWNTLLWYGFIIGLSSSLAKLGFFAWLAKVAQANLMLGDMNTGFVLGIIIVGLAAFRYLFASMGAFVTAFVPVAFTVGVAANVDPYVLTYTVAAATAYGCALTHYGGALGPILYGTGFVKQSTWWKIGFMYAVLSVIVYSLVGMIL